MPDASPPIRVVLLVFEGCDLLDVGGPYEVLLTANRLAERRGEAAPFEIRTVGSAPTVTAYGGLGLVASHSPGDLGRIDLLIVPGLIDVDAALGDTRLMMLVRTLAADAATSASVCTGAFLLAEVGALADRPATTHHEDLPQLEARTDVGRVVRARRWVDDGEVVTGAGLSSGLALGLHLVDRFVGRELATATARQIEHPWDPTGMDVVG